MSIARWEPFSEMMPLRDMMSRLMEESFIRPRSMLMPREMLSTFPLDVYETENEVVVKASLPGVRPEDIDVRITNNVITIQAEHREEREEGQRPQGEMARQQGQAAGQQIQQQGQQGQMVSRQRGQMQPTFHRREITYGSFYREIILPMEVQADKAQASFENGVLNLHLPKAEEAKSKRIQVQARSAGQQGQPRVQQGS